MALSKEAAGSTVCPVLSPLRQTTSLTPWCALSKVQEWKRSLVQFLPWSQMRLLTECYKMGPTPQKTFHSVHSTDFSGQDKELFPLCTYRVSVSGILAPLPSPSFWGAKGINYVRTITSSPLTQGSSKQTDFLSPSSTEPPSWSSSITQPHRRVMSTAEI